MNASIEGELKRCSDGALPLISPYFVLVFKTTVALALKSVPGCCNEIFYFCNFLPMHDLST